MRGHRGYHARLAIGRRDLLRGAGAALVTASCERGCGRAPELRWGVQAGDPSADAAVVWCRADRPSQMVVEWSLSPRFDRVTRVDGPTVSAESDLVGKVALRGLPPGTLVHYRARFDGSAWEAGSFTTAPRDGRSVVLAWSGDTNGQGFGIDPARGGMPAYAALLARKPELFIHCGDAIYADDPIPAQVVLDDGSIWRNLVDPAKVKVAESLDEFRGAHRYPRASPEVRALSAAVPIVHVWDDHEVRNNWFPGQILESSAYTEKRIDVLAARARQAMLEHTPTLRRPSDPIYRVIPWGPLVDVFLLDGRAYRSPNEPAPESGGLLGETQAAWLLDALGRSTAVWKVVACDMPIGIVVSEPGKNVAQAYDGWANADGPPREREVELARLLAGLKARKVRNVVWVTADVHYAAAHRLDPVRAAFKDFDPFWELVAGPMHARAFPRKPPDDTFGTEVEWASATWHSFGSPAGGEQSFGLLEIDGASKAMTVRFVDGRGRDLHLLRIEPV